MIVEPDFNGADRAYSPAPLARKVSSCPAKYSVSEMLNCRHGLRRSAWYEGVTYLMAPPLANYSMLRQQKFPALFRRMHYSMGSPPLRRRFRYFCFLSIIKICRFYRLPIPLRPLIYQLASLYLRMSECSLTPATVGA